MEVCHQADLLGAIRSATDHYGCSPNSALQVCLQIQHRFSCVPETSIPLIAAELGTTTGHIRSVITFYSFLHETPRGLYDVYISDSITDHMAGGQQLLQRLCSAVGTTPGKPRIDGRVTISATSCTGLCDQGPAGLVNGLPLTRLCTQRIDQIAALIESATPLDHWPREFFEVKSHIQRRGLLLSAATAMGSGLRKLAAGTTAELLAELEISGLNGRGGAGFSTASKWRICSETASDTRYVVCNADEGEPGTFKDRVILSDFADRVIEGMTMCGRVIGAEKGFIYLRGEYAFLKSHLDWVLERRRGDELLGKSILGDSSWCFDIEIHLGAGAYICGEESALIESLEGKRGIPRNRPPYPVSSGYLGRPTVVNNVETFLAAANIANHGGEWFASAGDGMGTKIHSVSGDCEHPGIYEFPVGTSVAEIIDAAGGGNAEAVQIAGAAGELLLTSEFDRRIDLKTLRSGGSFMIFGPQHRLFDTCRNFIHFFAHETCGFCAPCRSGTQLARSAVDRMAQGSAFGRDRRAIDRLIAVTSQMSHCGLGATALKPLRDLRDKCPKAYAKLFNEDQENVLHLDIERELSEIKSITGEVLGSEQ